MGNCLTLPTAAVRDLSKTNTVPLAIETISKLPSPIPVWPQGDGFATGIIDLGGLQVSAISSLNKVWTTHQGGENNVGASFYEPSQIPQGFFMLGSYTQFNSRPLSGGVLVGKDGGSTGALKNPVDYTLVWSSESLQINKDGNGYMWIPVPPDGYKAVGHVVTNSSQKPSLDKIMCVRSDLTDEAVTDVWIWGSGPTGDINGFNVFTVRPSSIGNVPVGTFVAHINAVDSHLSIACLKHTNSKFSSMPNVKQIEALMQAYSPLVYFHPDEQYLPSSVNWFFENGALLYKQGEEANPVAIQANGLNLPQGGGDDGAYWIDLPLDGGQKDRVKKGGLANSQVYVHVKPVMGATATDVVIWVFYPFNGPGRAKVEFVNIPLGKIGQHVGDWEHLTLRINNFNGELKRVYFSEHSKGTWVEASDLEFLNANKFVAYASLHGHAFYAKPGLVLQGTNRIGIRNDTDKSMKTMDTAGSFSIVSAEYLGSAITEPPWLNYARKWGPELDYDLADELRKVRKILLGPLKSAFDKVVKALPKEVLGEEGPTGPKMKSSWSGDEKV